MRHALRAVNTEHLVTQLVAQVAHIAIRSEGKVVVVASLANPIACPLVRPLRVRLLEELLPILIELERRFQRCLRRCRLVLGLRSVDLERLQSHRLLVLV